MLKNSYVRRVLLLKYSEQWVCLIKAVDMDENNQEKFTIQFKPMKELSREEIETRKLSAAAGGGLVGFAFGGPIGALIGAVGTSVAATLFFDNDETEEGEEAGCSAADDGAMEEGATDENMNPNSFDDGEAK